MLVSFLFCFGLFFGGGSKTGTGRKRLLENSFVFLYASPLHYSQHAPSRNAI